MIEGNNTAHRHFYEFGQAATCEISVKADFTERTVFLRGKGVTIQFERVRRGGSWQYKIKRIGSGNADFTVVATVDREATGIARKAPAKFQSIELPCPASEEDVTTAACGKPVTVRSDLGFKLRGNEFTIRPATTMLTTPALKSLEQCGKVQLTEGVTTPIFSWPNITDFEYAPLPEQKLFSGVHALAEALKGEDTSTSKVGTPPLVGNIEESGNDQVTVRFIRCGKHPFPACP